MSKKKSLAVNSIFNAVYKGFTALFPLITVSYVSRALLPERLGTVSYANTIVIYFTTVAALGLPNYGVKCIAKYGDNIKKRSKAFFELWVINTISTTIVSVLYFLMVNFIPYFHSMRSVMNIMGIILLLNYINLDWFYQGVEEYKIISVRSMVVKLASFGLIFLFVKSPNDYLKYAFILALGTAGNYVFNLFLLNKYVKLGNYKLHLRQHLRPVLILLAAALATEIYTALDTIMLEYYHGSASVAFYTNATKIVRMIYTMGIAFVATFYPRISYYIHNNEIEESNKLINQGIKIILLLAMPSTVGVFFTSEYIIHILYGNAYDVSIPILKTASILIFIFSLAYMLGHVILMASGKEQSILKATIVGALVNAVINFLLIPGLKEEGAILASVAAEIIVTFILIYSGRKMYKLNIGQKFLKSWIISLFIMIGVIFLTKSLVYRLPIVLSFFCIVVVAVTAYIGSLVLFKNPFIFHATNTFINKIRKGGV